MKKHEIVEGGRYIAKVSGTLVTVRVDKVRTGESNYRGYPRLCYDVTNMATGRQTTFRSAAKFRRPAATPQPEEPKP